MDFELAAAFAGINGLLGVKNRHRREVPALATERRLRRKLSFSRKDGAVRILSRWVRWVKVGGERVLQVSGDDELVRRLKEEGIEVVEEARPRLIVDLTYEVRLSNPKLRRAIARLALNYLATIDPHGARGPGAAALRRYVRHGREAAGSGSVWIDHDTNTYEAVAQRFRFGHRVAITFSQAEQRIWGHVCLYSCFGYGIDLGHAQVDRDRSYVWDIDPLAEREPADQIAREAPVLCFAKQRVTASAEADHRIRWLFRELSVRSWFRDAPPLVDALNGTRPLSLEVSEEIIFELLADQRQRLLALATESIRLLNCWLVHPRSRGRVERGFRHLISARASGVWGVARPTWRLVEAIRRDLSRALARGLVRRPFNVSEVGAFLVGLAGQAVAIRRMALMTRCRAAFRSLEGAREKAAQINAGGLEMLRQVRAQLIADRDGRTTAGPA